MLCYVMLCYLMLCYVMLQYFQILFCYPFQILSIHKIFTFRLEQAEDKYRNRESRPEDLQAIDLLRQSLAEREADCLKLVVSVFSALTIFRSICGPRVSISYPCFKVLPEIIPSHQC